MNVIPVTKYRPYEHIPLSREIVLNSLLPSTHYTTAGLISKITTIRRNSLTKHIRPVLVFGEMEWLVLNLACRARS